METEADPTRAQRRWIYALEGLYNDAELSPSERRRAEEIVASNEISLAAKEDFAVVASYLLVKNGRWRTLQTIYQNFVKQQSAGGTLDEWYFVSMAEFAEVQRLAQNEEFDTAIIRGCSFVEHFLDDNVDWERYAPPELDREEGPSFAELINFSREAGFLDDRDQKLLHFVREVRNHTAHHAWLKKDVEAGLVLLASRALLYVINRLMEERSSRDGLELPEFEAEPELAEQYIDRVEEDFGWTYQDYRSYWIHT